MVKCQDRLYKRRYKIHHTAILPFCRRWLTQHDTAAALLTVSIVHDSSVPVASEDHYCAGRWIGCSRANPAAPACNSYKLHLGTPSHSSLQQTELLSASQQPCWHRRWESRQLASQSRRCSGHQNFDDVAASTSVATQQPGTCTH